MTIGERIKRTRTAKGYTQGDVAKKLRIARSTLANYEQNIRVPSRKTVEALARLLNVTPAYLYGWEATTSVKEDIDKAIDALFEAKWKLEDDELINNQEKKLEAVDDVINVLCECFPVPE